MVKNRKCNYCGREYYCCKSCISINSWKNVCCSVECFRKMMQEGKTNMPQEINKEKGEKTMATTLLRAGLTNKDTIDIVGYDLELGKFDCSDGKTRVYEDFSYFIVPKNEMKEIVSYFEEKVKKLENERQSKQNKKKEMELDKEKEE